MNQENKIPKRLIQFWHDKNTIPQEYQDAIKNNLYFTKDFEVLFVDDKYMLDFIKRKDPFLYKLYSNINIQAIRADIARMLLLNEFGGIYMDLSMKLHKPLNSLISRESDVAILRRDDQKRYSKFPESAHFGIMILAAKPRTEFIQSVLKYLVDTIIEGFYNHHVLFATTKCVNEVFRVYKNSNLLPNLCIDFMSFKKFKQDKFLTHLRIKGLANSWKNIEEDGIINPNFLKLLRIEKKQS